MRVQIAVLTMSVVWVAGVTGIPARAQEAKSGRTVWDGVYTEEQAKRGGDSYAQSCQQCHGESLQGDGFAAPLAGPTFLGNWDGLSVGDLFERVRISMPPDAPGAVSRETKVDILTYVLKFNQFPAGQTELERETEKMKQIKFEATRPKGR